MPHPKKIFKVGVGWFEDDDRRPSEGHYVQDDTMAPILNHMNGKTYDSKSTYRKAVEGTEGPNGERYRIIGNDMKGKLELPKSKNISHEQFRDAKDYAESVSRDPAKLRAWRNEQNEHRAEFRDCGLGDTE